MRAALRIIGMALLALVVVSTSYLAGFGAGYLTRERQAPPAAVAAEGPAPAEFVVFWEAWEIVQRDFYGELPSTKEMTYGSIGGMVASLEDPNTLFFPPELAQEEDIELRGFYEGIGAVVTKREGQLVIVAPIEGSPAARAGIRAGDVVLKVDGEDITRLNLQEAVSRIRGPMGTTVTITIFRLGHPEPLEFTLVRARVDRTSVAWRMVEGNIAYVRLSFFGQLTGRELRKALQEARRQGARALILDLRNNPGGLLAPTTIEVASEFLKEGPLLYEQRTDRPEEAYPIQQGGSATDLPLVVLINRGTASAPEIVAGALQDYKRATLIGETTFGKGSIQLLHRLSDGSSLHITIGIWLTPKRRQVDKVGIAPDIAVPFTEEDLKMERDPQLEKAMEHLRSVMSRSSGAPGTILVSGR